MPDSHLHKTRSPCTPDCRNVSPSSSTATDKSSSSTRTTSTVGSSVWQAFASIGLQSEELIRARQIKSKRIEDVIRERRRRDMDEEAEHKRRDAAMAHSKASHNPKWSEPESPSPPVVDPPSKQIPPLKRNTVPQVEVPVKVDQVVDIPVSHANAKYEIRAVVNKGYGLIATADIRPGEIILQEAPFLVVDHPPVSKQIHSRVSALSLADQRLIQTFVPSLGKRYKSRLVDIVATNVIPLGGDPLVASDDDIINLDHDGQPEHQHRSGAFKTICRVNHACLPNAQWTWLVSSSHMIKWRSSGWGRADHLVLKALRPIPARHEITACYLQDPALGYDDRQFHLQDIWGFTCRCETCELPIHLRIARDNRLQRYRDLRDQYSGTENEQTWEREGLVACSKAIKDAIALLEKDGPIEEIAECRASLFQLSVRWGDEVKAQKEGKAWLRHSNKMGDELGPVMRQIVNKPRIATAWGMFDDDWSGDESECDSEDDFEKTQLQLCKKAKIGHSDKPFKPVTRLFRRSRTASARFNP